MYHARETRWKKKEKKGQQKRRKKRTRTASKRLLDQNLNDSVGHRKSFGSILVVSTAAAVAAARLESNFCGLCCFSVASALFSLCFLLFFYCAAHRQFQQLINVAHGAGHLSPTLFLFGLFFLPVIYAAFSESRNGSMEE